MLPIELKYFEEVATVGSIREAADRLHIAGSAVSRQISKLEEATGAALFKRTSSGMKLTQAGRVLLDYVHRCRADIEATTAKIRDVVAMRSGDLIIYASEGVFDAVLLQCVAEFHKHHDSIQIVIRTATSEESLRSLLLNSSDVAVVLNAPQRPEIEVVARIPQSVGLVALPSNSEDVWRRPVASVDDSHEFHPASSAAVAAAGISTEAAFSGNSIALVKQIVGLGLANGVVPRSAVEHEVSAERLVFQEFQTPSAMASAVHVCVRRDWSHAVAADEFLKILLRFMQS